MRKYMGHLGDALDRWDVGGWVMLLAGVGVIGLTLLAPALINTARLRAQRDALRRQTRRLKAQHDNYQAFIAAVKRGDPLLIQRLAWLQMHLRPEGAHALRDLLPAGPPTSASIQRWMVPPPQPRPVRPLVTLPSTHLSRLLTGPPRPWVLGFGGWLVLFGLMVNRGHGEHEQEQEQETEVEDQAFNPV